MFHQKLDVQSSIALGHCRVMQHRLAISIDCLVVNFASLIQKLNGVKLSIFNRQKQWCFQVLVSKILFYFYSSLNS
jgi:hypothetical protein